MSEPTPEPQPTEPTKDGESAQPKEQSFTQADVDRIIEDRLKRERETTKKKFGDYEELKVKAGEKATADERLATLEQQLKDSQREALKRRVQAAHSISNEDADLFLVGTDEDTLTAQAKRLADRESERKKHGNHVPREGNTPLSAGEQADAQFARKLFSPGE